MLRDASAGQLKPLYNYMDELPNLEGEPAPMGWGPAEPVEPAARPEPIVLQPSAGNRPYPSLQATLRAARKRSRRGDRAEEASAIRWGGVAVAAR